MLGRQLSGQVSIIDRNIGLLCDILLYGLNVIFEVSTLVFAPVLGDENGKF